MTWGVPLSVSYQFFLFILLMGFSRQEYWSGLPFPSPVAHILPDLSTMTHPSWVAPQAWLGFTELDKAVVLMWLDWLVFCEYGFSVSALWCPLATLTILLGFLLPWRGVSLHGCSSKTQPLFLTLDKGYLLTTAVPDLQCGIAPLVIWIKHFLCTFGIMGTKTTPEPQPTTS